MRNILLLATCVAFSAQAQSNPDALKKEALAEVDRRATQVQQMVDQIFSYAELGFQEFETSKYLVNILRKEGFQVEEGVAGIPTAWVATFKQGTGKPAIGFITDIDCIPRASQKPGVAYHDPVIEGAPGHGEGHNSGMAVNVVSAIVLKNMMQKNNLSGTLKIYPGVAEELVATKAFFVRAGLFKDLDVMLGVHVSNDFTVSYGQPSINSGLVSVQYTFKGDSAHAAGAPWRGRSALDGVELMNVGWNYKREHLRTEQRSHYVIVNGGDQPNVVPDQAIVWYYFRELDYAKIKELHEFGSTMAKGAAMMSGTTFTQKIVGSAWPNHFNKVLAETMHKNIESIGMPTWSEDDQTLAKALQRELNQKAEGLKVKASPLEPPKDLRGGGSDDVGDISWIMPMIYTYYPANIPNLPGHHWANAVAMATPIAHKGSLAGAKAQAATAIDLLTKPEIVKQAWDYFTNVQTKEQKYQPLIGSEDVPAIDLNADKMARYREQMKKTYYDPSKHKTYLEQLGITYPTVRK